MALSLSAEQKELLKIFKIEEQYIIPPYQRPYSWEYDQCFQLYTDLINAFKVEEDYFIGNIIIAKSDANKDTLEVIDGQQRLITLLLLFKVLHCFQPTLKVLSLIIEQEDWEGIGHKPRIKSEIFEAKDGNDLTKVLNYSENDLKIKLSDCIDKNGKIVIKNGRRNKFEINILYFYNWINYYSSKNNDLKDFTSFLLKRVFLLPIELNGKTQSEANEKALVIFETINNRGMNLEDADIFKAKLFNKAKKIKEEDLFISLWGEFKEYCNSLSLDVDDVFRYYSHIIRGKNGITSSEIKLREFFTRESYSPFEQKKYKAILDDLFKILNLIEFVNQERSSNSNAAIWFELIEIYTNQYPKFAVISYLFVNGTKINANLINFLKSLVRYTYIQGSTTRVKFEIYNMIKQLNNQQEILNYYSDIDSHFFEYLGRLKNGFVLLGFYLTHKKMISPYYVEQIIQYRDDDTFEEFWEYADIEYVRFSIGNYILLDLPRKNQSFDKRTKYYKKSKLNDVHQLFSEPITYEKFSFRKFELIHNLLSFFNEPNE